LIKNAEIGALDIQNIRFSAVIDVPCRCETDGEGVDGEKETSTKEGKQGDIIGLGHEIMSP